MLRYLRDNNILLVIFIYLVFAVGYVASANNKDIEDHVRSACNLAWSEAKHPSVIDRCATRTMAALGTLENLRNNELKGLLMRSEAALEKCQGGRDGSTTKK